MKRHLPLYSLLFVLCLAPATAILDSNNNGVSDLWELASNDGELFDESFDPLDDPDFDGWTNEQEAAAGTNPFDPNPPDGIIRPDIVRTPAVMGVANGQPIIMTPEAATVSWPTIPGKQYALLCSPDLTSESWLTVDQPFIGNGNIPEFHFQIQGDEKYFWKVAVCDVDTDGDTLTDAEEYQMGTNAFVMDSDADGMDDNVDPQPNVGCPSFADADGDGIPDEYDNQPEVSAGVAPAISSEAATISRIVNVAAGDSLVFLVNVENPDGPPVTASDLKLFVSGTEDSASFTSAGGKRFSVTWTAQVHAEYPAKVLQNLSVRFEDARKATAWLEVARLDVAEWQGMVAGLAVRYDNVTTRTFCIGGHSGGVQLAPAQWSGAFGTGPRWYRGPRNVKFYGRDPNEAPPGVNLGTLSISTGMRYPLFIMDDTGTPAAPGVTVKDISNPVQYPHGFWGLNQWSGQIKMEGTGATSLIAAGTNDFIPLPQPGGVDTPYTFEAKFLQDGEWQSVLNNIWPVYARTSSRAMQALTVKDPNSSGEPTALEWGIRAPIEARIVASAAGSLDYPGLPQDNLLELRPLFLAPNQWHRIVVKVGPDAAVVARGVRLRLNIGVDGTDAPQNGFEFKRKTATGFESFTPGEILEGSALYSELTSQIGLVLFAKLSPAIDRLHRLSLDLLPNSDTLTPLEIRKLELVPVDIDDNNPATGVDDVSITADPSDIGYQSRFWIMAPSGNDPSGNRCSDDMKFKIPMEPASKVRMDCTLAHCEYRYPVDSNAASPAVPIGHGVESAVRWLGTGAESGDLTPIYKLGDAQQVDLPVGIKVMKRRTVKVQVCLVNLLRSNGEVRELDSLMIPSEDSIRAHLYEVFTKQLNAWFEVHVEKNPNGTLKYYQANPGTDGDFSFNFQDNEQTSADQQQTLDQTGNGAGNDIRVFLIANEGSFLVQNEALAKGFTNQSAATCWILGRPTGSYNGVNDVNSSIAHEIGHVFVRYGHPDLENGIAPLVGTDRTLRLMCSGPNRSLENGRLLVKTEWDEAEKWLIKVPDKRIRLERSLGTNEPTGNY